MSFQLPAIRNQVMSRCLSAPDATSLNGTKSYQEALKNQNLLSTQLKMGCAYTLGVGVYIRKGCKSLNLSLSKTKGISHTQF